MRLTLISHASVIVDCGDVVVWTDPWLVSKAFNNSWAMVPEPSSDRAFLDRVTHLWLSHEHPDHFNIPTLKSLPQAFRERVVVCFQKRNTHKIFDALRKLGFRNFLELPNRTRVAVGDTTLYCYQTGLGDSALGIAHGDRRVLDVNDAELGDADHRRVLADFGAPDILLDQFSIAGYFGYRDRAAHLPRTACEKLVRLARDHRALHAKLTIPFASFVAFCTEDNAYLNAYANRPRGVSSFMRDEGCACHFMAFGETLEVGAAPPDDTAAIDAYERAFAATRIEPSPRVELSEIEKAYDRFHAAIEAAFPRVVRDLWLGDIVFDVPDLDCWIRVGAGARMFETLPRNPDGADVIVNSQPLWFGFAFPFGFETLGVSGRYTVNRFRRWQAWKRMSILNNLEVGLRPKLLLAPPMRAFLRERIASGLVRQLVAKQLRRLRMELGA